MVAGRTLMHLTPVQDQAIAARMALIVGGIKFDRLFACVRFDEVDGDILFVYARDEEIAAGWRTVFRASHLDHRDGHSQARSRHHGVAETTGSINAVSNSLATNI
jgi:hypothetical protein